VTIANSTSKDCQKEYMLFYSLYIYPLFLFGFLLLFSFLLSFSLLFCPYFLAPVRFISSLPQLAWAKRLGCWCCVCVSSFKHLAVLTTPSTKKNTLYTSTWSPKHYHQICKTYYEMSMKTKMIYVRNQTICREIDRKFWKNTSILIPFPVTGVNSFLCPFAKILFCTPSILHMTR
jgi:hypothetical protein